jgi:hypothetical protein
MARKYVSCTSASPGDPEPRHPRHVGAGDPEPAAVEHRQRPGEDPEAQRDPQLAQMRRRDPVFEQELRDRPVRREHQRRHRGEGIAQARAATAIGHEPSIVAAAILAPTGA